MKTATILTLLAAVLLASAGPGIASGPEPVGMFAARGVEGCFVMHDARTGRTVRHNPERCAIRFLPASTFKILNSLIALETGVSSGPDFVITWDGQVRDLPAWNQDQTMTTAFRNSTVWYYQEIARRIGETPMRDYVTRSGYGNADISGGIDIFWLRGALRISADEQIAFLRKVRDGGLPFTDQTRRTVMDMMREADSGTPAFHTKTGLATVQNVGWYVGWVETSGGPCFFALNLTPVRPGVDLLGARKPLARDLLKYYGVL